MANIPFLNNAYFSAKVGIGTETSYTIGGTAQVTIATGSAETALSFGPSNNDMVYMRGAGSQGNFQFQTSVNGGNSGSIQLQPFGGNVGIGTTSPRTKLEIGASGSLGSVTNKVISATFDGGYSLLNSLQYNVNAFIGTTFGTTDIFAQTSGEVLKNFYVGLVASNSYFNGSRYSITQGGAERLTVAIGGNVGIGTTSPTAAKLVVDSDTAPQILVKNSGGGNAQILFEDNDGGTQNASITYDQGGDNTLTIATGYQSPTDLNRINISPAGNVGLTVRGGTGGSGLGQPLVGIGTTSPTEKLEVVGNIKITAALLSSQENTDVDTGTETVANVEIATYTAAFFDFVIKKTTNVRSGTVYACHDGTSVVFTETSTNDLGDTSDVTLSVDISGTNMRLLATVTSDDWSVKSLIRAI